jgi:hypothetical protein
VDPAIGTLATTGIKIRGAWRFSVVPNRRSAEANDPPDTTKREGIGNRMLFSCIETINAQPGLMLWLTKSMMVGRLR